MPDDRELDLGAVVVALTARGIDARVENTGGGCATITVGEPVPDVYGDPRYPAAAGPGWFTAEGPRGLVGDFYVGLDDDGESPVEVVLTDSPDACADLIVAVLNRYEVERRLASYLASPEAAAADAAAADAEVDELARWERMADGLRRGRL